MTITKAERSRARVDAQRWGAWLLAAGLTFLLTGCKEPVIIQKDEVKSLDGYWIARMEMEQFAGPGNAALFTRVYLVRTGGPGEPIEILSFSEPSIDAGQVQMIWINNEHLEVSHSNEATVEFQAIKAAGVEISLN